MSKSLILETSYMRKPSHYSLFFIISRCGKNVFSRLIYWWIDCVTLSTSTSSFIRVFACRVYKAILSTKLNTDLSYYYPHSFLHLTPVEAQLFTLSTKPIITFTFKKKKRSLIYETFSYSRKFSASIKHSW